MFISSFCVHCSVTAAVNKIAPAYEFGRATFCIHTLDYTQYQLSTTTTRRNFRYRAYVFSVRLLSPSTEIYSLSLLLLLLLLLLLCFFCVSICALFLFILAHTFANRRHTQSLTQHTQKQNMCNEHF